MTTIRVALAQLNVTVGDLAGNQAAIAKAFQQAREVGAELVACPELAVTGYPPEDLLLKPQFVTDNLAVLRRVVRQTRGLLTIIGFVDRDAHGRLYNAAAVAANGRVLGVYRKLCLPNYGVFDERRYFTPGRQLCVIEWPRQGARRHVLRIGLTICEDLWETWPTTALVRQGRIGALLNISASPYHAGKLQERLTLIRRQATAHRISAAYLNLVGGQDELVFDGGSVVLDARGRLLAQGRQYDTDLLVVDLPVEERPSSTRRRQAADSALSVQRLVVPMWERQPLLALQPASVRAPLEPLAEMYAALVLGTRDYTRKNGFTHTVVGLSGGVDSSLTAAIAVDALGREHVSGVSMPSRYSSSGTQRDAEQVARALGIRLLTISIEPVFGRYLETLAALFKGRPTDVAEQNIQARIRGTLLMALANKFGWLVLTTGNKSEMATGYCTLYGDMAGGFAVIKDVPKQLVYQLSRFRNQHGPGAPIPESVLRRVPTAELAPNQTDQDTLPPYDVLDRLVEAYVEQNRSARQLVRQGITAATVRRVIRMIDRAEYKRRQGPPGIKITPRAFGKDRRMPITNRYQER